MGSSASKAARRLPTKTPSAVHAPVSVPNPPAAAAAASASSPNFNYGRQQPAPFSGEKDEGGSSLISAQANASTDPRRRRPAASGQPSHARPGARVHAAVRDPNERAEYPQSKKGRVYQCKGHAPAWHTAGGESCEHAGRDEGGCVDVSDPRCGDWRRWRQRTGWSRGSSRPLPSGLMRLVWRGRKSS